MNIISRSFPLYSNYFSLDTFNTIDRRILILAAFILGYLTRFLLEPMSRTTDTVKKLKKTGTKATVGHKRKISTRSESSSSLKSVKKSASTTASPSPTPMPKAQAKPMPANRANPQNPKQKVVSLCFKNILPTEGKVTPAFMTSFSSQLEKQLQGCTVKQYDLSQTSLSNVSGNRVLLYFTNVKSRLQPSAINTALNLEKQNYNSSKDYSVLLLNTFSFSDVVGADQIDLKSNNIDAKGEIMRGMYDAPDVSPKQNIKVAKNIAVLVKAKFKI